MTSLNSTSGGPFDRPPEAPVSRIVLVRHGSTEANEKRPFVLQGSEIDGPLTPYGVRQAAALTRFLSPISFSAIYSSPMRRALETVREIAASRSLDVRKIEAFRECQVGEWMGLSWDEIRQQDPERCARFLADPASECHPGGESFRDLRQRVLPTFDELLTRHPGENVLVLAHNLVNRVILATKLGIELRLARTIRQSNCCINVIEHGPAGTEVVTLNSIWHLPER